MNNLFSRFEVVVRAISMMIAGSTLLLILSGSFTLADEPSRLLAVSTGKTIKLVDANTGEMVKELRGHKKGVVSIAFSPDGSFLASVSKDATIILWDIATGDEISRLTGAGKGFHAALSISPDGNILAEGGCTKFSPGFSGCLKGRIRLVNLETRATLFEQEWHPTWVNSIDFSPDGKYVAFGSQSEERDGYEKRGGLLTVIEVATGDTVKRIYLKKQTIGPVKFSPDNKFLVAGAKVSLLTRPSLAKGEINIWDAQSFEKLQTLVLGSLPVTVGFSSDGKFLVGMSVAGKVSVWRTDTWEQVSQFRGARTNLSPGLIAFSPDGSLFALGKRETVTILDGKTFTHIRDIKVTDKDIYYLAFQPQ